MPWQDVIAWQASQIMPFLAELQGRSEFYAHHLGGLEFNPQRGEVSQLQDVPVTLKDHIKSAQEEGLDAHILGCNQSVPNESLIQVISSSGTTGKPLYYGLTARDIAVWSDAIAQNFFTAGVRKEDVVAHLVGLPMVAGGLPYADAFRRIGATLCWLGGFPTDRILREMRRLQVSCLLATTSFGTYLAGQWEGVGQEVSMPSRLKKMLCGGEPGLNQPAVRSHIHEKLQISTLSEVMGLGDVVSAMWGECEAQSGMHFNAQRYVHVELIDPETCAPIAWKEGATGELVYTTFMRDATPVVRYRSRDHAQVMGMDCPCGRSSPKIRCIGRTDDMLIYKGMNVFPTAVRDLITENFSDVVEPVMKIWKDSPDQVRFDNPLPMDIELKDETSTLATDVIRERIEALIRSQLQVRVAVNLVRKGDIQQSAYKNSLLGVREKA